MSPSLLLKQYPACLVRQIVFVMGGGWPHNCCFVGCCLQDLFNIACFIFRLLRIIIGKQLSSSLCYADITEFPDYSSFPPSISTNVPLRFSKLHVGSPHSRCVCYLLSQHWHVPVEEYIEDPRLWLHPCFLCSFRMSCSSYVESF